MSWKLIRSIIALPGIVLVLIPGAILLLTRDSPFAASWVPASSAWYWLGLVLTGVGSALIIWAAISMLASEEVTPAPWDASHRLVTRGPYRYVRNPMTSGVILILAGITLLSQSLVLAFWTLAYLIFSLVYFPLVEEKDLQGRFGEQYLEYKEQVPRWRPRRQPWEGDC